MNHQDALFVLATMTVADFKRFKRALRVLLASGIGFDSAVSILTTARSDRHRLTRAV